jgi:uncharacterized iron-regulated membrane protein
MTFPRMTFHRTIFWLHLLTGTIAGLVILVMSVTGVLLAFEPQIVDYFEQGFRQVTPPSPTATKLGMDAILAKVKEARPDARPIMVVGWSGPQGTVRVGFGRDDGVFVNPYTGELLGPGSKVHDAMHVIEDWHRWLGSRDVGRPVTGACNLAFLGLAITGIYIWWPRKWNRHVLRGSLLFDARLCGRARDWNWHNTIGFWCAPVLIVLTLTGVVMSYQWANDLLYRLTGTTPPPAAGMGPGGGMAPAPARPPGQREGQRPPDGRLRDAGPGRRDGERPRSAPGREPASVGALWARAEQQTSGWVSIFLRLPPRPGGPVTAFIQEPGPPGPGPNPRSLLTLDPFTAQVVKWEPYASANAGRKLRTWFRYLHTGETFGVAGQLVAGLASAGGVMLVWTGLALTWRRFFAWRARRADARRPRQGKSVLVEDAEAPIDLTAAPRLCPASPDVSSRHPPEAIRGRLVQLEVLS